MKFETHPRQIARYRDSKPAVTIASFICRAGKHVCYTFAGRRKAIGGGWSCADCSTVSVLKTEMETAPSSAL